MELDELAHHSVGAQDLRDAQGEVGGGDAFGELPVEVDADYFGNEEGDRLPEHARLCLDAAHAPTDDAQAVDHGGVRVCAHQRVRVVDLRLFRLLRKHALGEKLEVDLMNDSDSGGTTEKVSKACWPHLRNS